MSQQPSATSSPAARLRATPRARRLLRERGGDPARIKGSGPGGRITAVDVAGQMAGPVPAAPASGVRRPLSAMRRTIARRLAESKQTIPHFYLRQTIDAGPLAAAFARCKQRFPCSLNDLIVRSAALVVREFAAFRSRLEGDEVIELAQVHIGVAVGLDDGLVVPAVLDADRLGLRELAAETRRLVESARAGRVENTGRGVFTVTNLGMFGTEEFTAIINPPEVAILAAGAIRERVVVRDGRPSVGQTLTLTLSCDHRIIDGLAAAKFMARLEQILVSPQE
jgi:pyruvate dehydrogenase E2 component (dihydrolipoamide acetyltransferase)